MISRLPRWVWTGGAVLSFVAGMVNAIAFLSFVHQASTHITGIITHFSLKTFQADFVGMSQSGFSILFFFTGAALSGLIVRDGHLRMGRRYGVALTIECALLLFSTWAFHEKMVLGEYLACMAAGVQNAMVSTYSGAIVRTTHMTGILTDLGSLIGQWLGGVSVSFQKIKLLVGILLAFFWGGFCGAFAYGSMGYLAMLIPATIVGICALVYLWLRHHYHLKTI